MFKYAIGLIDNNHAREQLFVYFFARTKRDEFILKTRLFSKSILPSILNEGTLDRLNWASKTGA